MALKVPLRERELIDEAFGSEEKCGAALGLAPGTEMVTDGYGC